MSPTFSESVTRGITRALQTDEVQNLKKDKRLQRHKSFGKVPLQSTDVVTGETQDEDDPTPATQTMQYVDESPGQIMNFPSLVDESYYENYKIDSTLANFLSRPVLIRSYTWTEGTSITTTGFNPWEDFLNNAVIKAKIEQYNFFNGTLKLKILINASPFYYGCLGFFYKPLQNWNTGVVTPSFEGSKVLFSQQPHVWVYPQTSQGAEMKLPFFYHKNWLDITSLTDVQNMGLIQLLSYTNLLNANSVVGSDCDIQIYAWAEDVHLCGPTRNAALQSTNEKKKKSLGEASSVSRKNIPQKKTIKSKSNLKEHQSEQGGDKYDHAGKISKPASAVARVAGSVGLVATGIAASNPENPIGWLAGGIARASGAVSTVATVTSEVAEAFGYTNTPNIAGVQPYKSLPFHSMASSEISQPIEKLTFDPKNELLIDGKTTGIQDHEELNIDSFCRRESYLTTFTWTSADVFDALLWGSRVTPNMMVLGGIAPNRSINKTPMSLVNDLFRYWRGDIVFRFRFMATKYHRGRVRITWDPSDNLAPLTDTNTTNYNVVLDINECPDVRLRIPYLQAQSWLKTDRSLQQNYGTGAGPVPNNDVDNGQLTVRVFTQQTSPIASADIPVIVSVYGEKMEFSNPMEAPQTYGFYNLQSADEIKEQYPEGIGSACMFEDSTTPPDLNLVTMGENIISLKQILRRHTLTEYIVDNADGVSRFRVFASERNRLPLYYGFDPNGVFTANDQIGAGTSTFNFVLNTPFNYIGACFVACRGSVSWQFNAVSQHDIAHFRAHRLPEPITVFDYGKATAVAAGLNKSATSRALQTTTYSGFQGQSLTNQKTQSALSVIVPMYNRYRFRNAGPTNRSVGIADDDSDIDNFRVEYLISPASDPQADKIVLTSYFAIGSDFDFHFFLNVPTLAENALPTAP